MSNKTNAVRSLERKGLPFKLYSYPCPEALSAVEIAQRLDMPHQKVFKTLVTEGRSGSIYVFMVPAAEELDLRKAAAAAGEKSVSMLKSRLLLPLTGYVHGGCSPIGMKKQFPTFIHLTAEGLDTIIFSGGRIGLQIECSPAVLKEAVPASYADIITE
ncbi:MAG: aminoacyl-tRNA deacylase [Abditibacteriota bacterium]|nr:aminoacyl-tRNA deacylase [Abditibacteriota bacterium]